MARHSAKQAWLVIGVVGLGGAVVPAAMAQPAPPPPTGAAVYEYRESLPTSKGAVVPGVGAIRPVAVPAAIRSRLRSIPSREAATLERVATSPALGAPLPPSPTRGDEPFAAAAFDPPGLGSAAGRALTADARLIALVLAMLVVGVAAPLARRARPAPVETGGRRR